MKTEWDYTNLAAAYVKRPDYSDEAIDRMLARAKCGRGSAACDVGAGAAHLTIKLAQRGLEVRAVEPNDAMRAQGIKRTQSLKNVRWSEGTGEATGQPAAMFDIVTFGSSFNVTDRPKALTEARRLLKPRGWFACMWNHRDLDDPLQSAIEATIRRHIRDYDYGARREDQTAVILASGYAKAVETIEGPVMHRQSVDDCIEAWRSHATLQRQAGERFDAIVEEIAALVRKAGSAELHIPYVSRIWLAQFA